MTLARRIGDLEKLLAPPAPVVERAIFAMSAEGMREAVELLHELGYGGELRWPEDRDRVTCKGVVAWGEPGALRVAEVHSQEELDRLLEGYSGQVYSAHGAVLAPDDEAEGATQT